MDYAPKNVEIVSVTDLTSYMYCPRLLYRQKVLGYEEKPSLAMVLGAMRHNFHDLANRNDEELVMKLPNPESSEEAAAAYSALYNELLGLVVRNHGRQLSAFGIAPEEILQRLQPLALAEAAERARNVCGFATQHHLSGEELWQKLSPKILTELKVKSAALRLKGIIDRVEISDGTVLPVELKTGKMSKDGVWPSHRVQVAAYMMLLQERFNTAVSKAVIRYLDHGSSRTVVLNPYMEMEVKELTEKVMGLLQSENLPKPCGREGCACYLLR